MIYATSKGSLQKTTSFLEFMQSERMFSVLNQYGRTGVDILASATPRETGETADAWGYQVSHRNHRHSISWFNTHREGNIIVAVILQYGHGTGTGGYVQGIDYINPAMRPFFDKVVDDIWRQVRNG